MSQLAFSHDAAPPMEAPPVPLDGDVAPSLSISLFGADERRLAMLAQDARAVGMTAHAARPLESLNAHASGVLGDIVIADCTTLAAAAIAALMRLDERVARSGAQLVVLISQETLDTAFACLATSRPQFVVGGERAEAVVALGIAMARLSGSRLREMNEEERLTLLRLTEQVERLAEKIDRFEPARLGSAGARLESPGIGFLRSTDEQRPALRQTRPPLPDPRLVQKIIRRRQTRARFFDAELFADPAWDILLDLTAARAEHRRVSVTSLCIAAGVPTTTALRWISQMVESGMLVRLQDQEDRRRAFIALSDDTADRVARYFDALGSDPALAV